MVLTIHNSETQVDQDREDPKMCCPEEKIFEMYDKEVIDEHCRRCREPERKSGKRLAS